MAECIQVQATPTCSSGNGKDSKISRKQPPVFMIKHM